jgi:DNA-binding Xre family transcriptional regulator
MSNFGIALKEMLQEKEMTASDLSKSSAVSPSQISRLLSGEQMWLSAPDLESICLAISEEKIDHAKIVRAYLMDQYKGSGSDLLNIEIRANKDALKENVPAYGTKLPHSLLRKLEIVGQAAVEDEDVMSLLDTIVNLRTKGKL